MTVELKCTCKNDFMDKVYGNQIRVFNLGYGGKEATCTVCGTKHKTDKK